MKEDDNIPAKDFINGPLHGIYKNGEWEFPTCSKKINPISSKRKKRLGKNVQYIHFKVSCKSGR